MLGGETCFIGTVFLAVDLLTRPSFVALRTYRADRVSWMEHAFQCGFFLYSGRGYVLSYLAETSRYHSAHLLVNAYQPDFAFEWITKLMEVHLR